MPVVFLFSTLFAFSEGTINPGGSISLGYIKNQSGGEPYASMYVAPQLGYFILKNVAVDVIPSLSLYSQSGKNSNGDHYDSSSAALGLGLGGRCFYENLYGGLALRFNYSTYHYESVSYGYRGNETSLSISPKLGCLVQVAKNVFGDIRVSYDIGIGKVKNEDNVNGIQTNDNYDNELRNLNISMGLQVFFPMN